MSQNKRGLPIVISDIDGVAFLGSRAIPGLKEGLQRVNSTVGTSSKTVPFMFLSNGGGCSEAEKAALMNKVSGLVSENGAGP